MHIAGCTKDTQKLFLHHNKMMGVLFSAAALVIRVQPGLVGRGAAFVPHQRLVDTGAMHIAGCIKDTQKLFLHHNKMMGVLFSTVP